MAFVESITNPVQISTQYVYSFSLNIPLNFKTYTHKCGLCLSSVQPRSFDAFVNNKKTNTVFKKTARKKKKQENCDASAAWREHLYVKTVHTKHIGSIWWDLRFGSSLLVCHLCSLGNILPCCIHLHYVFVSRVRCVCVFFFIIVSLSSKFIYILKLRKWTCLTNTGNAIKCGHIELLLLQLLMFLLFFKAVHTRFYGEILKVQIQALKPDSVMLFEFMRFSSLLVFFLSFLLSIRFFFHFFLSLLRSSLVAQ